MPFSIRRVRRGPHRVSSARAGRSGPAAPAASAGAAGRGGPKGFTLIELLIALVLTGLVAASIYQVLLNQRRISRQQTERVGLQGNVRAAVAMVPGEFLELNAGDTVDSDLVALEDTSVTVKAMRSTYFLCQAPVDLGTTGTVILWQSPSFGLRGLEADRDSVLIFAEGNTTTRTDNYWVHANVAEAPVPGTLCPGNAPSLTVALTNVYPANGLSAVQSGAPVRAFELVQLFTYPDVAGDYWLGQRVFSKSGGWGDVQPVLGPLAAEGLQFEYLDADGNETADRSAVVRVGISVIGRTAEPVRSSGGEIEYVLDTLATQVALRNNPR